VTLIRGISYQVLAQAIAIAAGLAAVPLLSRHLGVSGYGVFVTVMAFVALLSAISDLGLGATTVREVAAQRVPDGSGVGSAMGVRVLLAVWVVLGGLVVAIAMHQPQSVVIGIAVAAGYVVLIGIGAVGPNVVLQVYGEFKWLAGAAAAQAVVWLAGLAVVVMADLDVVGAIVALTFASLAALLVSGWAANRRLVHPAAFDRRIAAALLRQGVSLGVASLLAMAYYRVDAILLAAIAGTSAAGLYGAAYRFIDQARLLGSYIGTAGHAGVARASADVASFRASVSYMVRVAAVAGVVVGVALFVLAEPLTGLLFGAQFSGAPDLLKVLAIAVPPLFLNSVIPYAMIAQRRQAVYIWINLAALAINLGGNLLLIPRFGAVACAWLTVTTECLVLTLSLSAVWWTLHFVPGLDRVRRVRIEASA